MKNPFEGLSEERQYHQDKAALRQESKRGALSRQRVDLQARAREKHRYDALVMELLGLLKQAIFPGKDQVGNDKPLASNSSHQLISDDESWSIGLWTKGQDGALVWHKTLEVRLAYDEVDGRALHFECRRHNRLTRAELSRESLLEALQKLYPLEEHHDPRLARRHAKRRLDSLVREAYEAFQKTAPKELRLAGDADGWSIGSWQNLGGELVWNGRIMIQLRFDWKNKPKGFSCSAGSRRASAGLSKDELVSALLKVFPPKS